LQQQSTQQPQPVAGVHVTAAKCHRKQQKMASSSAQKLMTCIVFVVVQINSNYALQGRKRPDDFRRGEIACSCIGSCPTMLSCMHEVLLLAV
jgi:hypothetical protein